MTVRTAARWFGLLALAAGPWGAVRAEAGDLRGSAELQYQSSERVGITSPSETWVKVLRMDYARRLPRLFELSSHLVLSEQTLAGRPDRVRAPEGTLQLAHPFGSLLASYRPVELRDATSVTTRNREASLNGNLQLPHAPRLTGMWVRRSTDGFGGAPGTATVTRSLAGTYTWRALSLRGGAGDQYHEGLSGPEGRASQSHYTFGGSSQFRLGRAGFSSSYDFAQSRSNLSGAFATSTRQNTAVLTGSMPITRKLASALAYSFRRSETLNQGPGPIDEHDGSLSLGYQWTRALLLSGAGGVRTARLNGGTQAERYVSATATAQGQVRPGWRMDAAASHSVNWLPGQSARPVDNLRSTTSMHLATGLDVMGDASLSAARAATAAPGSPLELALQAGGGVNANPLRTVFVLASVHRYRAGASLVAGGTSATTYDTQLRLRPSDRLQMNGGWGLATNLGTRSTSWLGGLQWTPRPTFQLSGSWARSRQERSDFVLPGGITQESVSGSLIMAVSRDLNLQLRYSEANPGHTGSVRQLNAVLIQRFGR